MINKPTLLESDSIPFETQGRLLQELGERLVSNSEVALTELIKNSYDADAVTCEVSRNLESIVITDTGHGISKADFIGRWMRIATGGKQTQRISPLYKRKLTGAKGIGRFAARFLGKVLVLDTISDDPESGRRVRLTATFDWERIDRSVDLNETRIEYKIHSVDKQIQTGTTLTISKLRSDDDLNFGKALKTQLMGIVSPLGGLERGHLKEIAKDKNADPGFTLVIPGDEGSDEEVNLARKLLSHYYARLVISHRNGKVNFTITHQDKRELLSKDFDFPSHISLGLHADIRYFPKRKGMFLNTGVDGHRAWKWVKENRGVGVIDHGFRISPYGYEEDDWLRLDKDTARNRRHWRSPIMEEHYPIGGKGDQSLEKSNPMLYLPAFHQLVGGVFIESSQTSDSSYPTDLTPASDREGLLENAAFREVVQIVRTGMELLAFVDHKENRRIEQEKAKKEAASMRRDFKAVVNYVRDLPTLTRSDKERITKEYTSLVKKLENVEDYHRQANEKMDTMSMLGVLAGFMTHESRRLISELDGVISYLRDIAPEDRKIMEKLALIEPVFEEFKGQVEYGSTFIEAIQNSTPHIGPIPVRDQVDLVTDRFVRFSESRGITVEFDGDPELEGPVVQTTLYSGILLNLFTNALKAVVARPAGNDPPRVAIKAWNEGAMHILEVVDNGVGIPLDLQNRIWDPLFTTTSVGTVNPLGSGMGLGLTLVKLTVERARGKISLTAPPAGFKTCFRVQFPLKQMK